MTNASADHPVLSKITAAFIVVGMWSCTDQPCQLLFATGHLSGLHGSANDGTGSNPASTSTSNTQPGPPAQTKSTPSNPASTSTSNTQPGPPAQTKSTPSNPASTSTPIPEPLGGSAYIDGAEDPETIGPY